ncbi:conserved hypothetical protein [Histoplasma capsulatum var. duboisii H88]|uniref:Uncharacterized protein n=1 Tax=Ajellomyces capsulatus (strain H88) TaxID=544711 RepID=F0UKF1_AJEC8|nr:conserved hypothetical protein [Histoplasma capsulatum var. duboisii H88]
MEPSIPDVGRRVATVSDMIQWLWHDGFYRGEVGWSAEWDPGAIFGTPNSTLGAYVFGVSTLCGEKAGRPLHLEPNVDKISDVAVEGAANAGFPETLFGDAHAKKEDFEGWKALCDEQDFTDLMQALLKDGSKEAKMAIVCHEITLETAKQMMERQSETEVYKKSTFYTWDGELDNSSDMGEANSNMAVDGCMPIPDDFDWSQLIDEEVAQWEEDSPN